MRLTAAAVVLATALVFTTSQNPVVRPDSSFAAPPSAAMFLILSLGRPEVAADFAWLAVVQRVGSQRFAERGYPDLEDWLDVTTTLSPRFEMAYFVGASFLAADSKRSGALDRLLARGGAALPASYYLPMAQGFVHYFGRYDPHLAAVHFRRAAGFPDAPPFLGPLAARLDGVADSCRELSSLLRDVQFETNQLFAGQRPREILVSCIERAIERAAASWRLQHGTDPTLDDLVTAGLLEQLVAPPGECWHLNYGVATLEPCP